MNKAILGSSLDSKSLQSVFAAQLSNLKLSSSLRASGKRRNPFNLATLLACEGRCAVCSLAYLVFGGYVEKQTQSIARPKDEMRKLGSRQVECQPVTGFTS